MHFQAFREPKIQNFSNHVATSEIYWVHYKPLVLSYSEVGTYVRETSRNHLLKLTRFLIFDVVKKVTFGGHLYPLGKY